VGVLGEQKKPGSAQSLDEKERGKKNGGRYKKQKGRESNTPGAIEKRG